MATFKALPEKNVTRSQAKAKFGNNTPKVSTSYVDPFPNGCTITFANEATYTAYTNGKDEDGNEIVFYYTGLPVVTINGKTVKNVFLAFNSLRRFKYDLDNNYHNVTTPGAKEIAEEAQLYSGDSFDEQADILEKLCGKTWKVEKDVFDALDRKGNVYKASINRFVLQSTTTATTTKRTSRKSNK